MDQGFQANGFEQVRHSSPLGVQDQLPQKADHQNREGGRQEDDGAVELKPRIFFVSSTANSRPSVFCTPHMNDEEDNRILKGIEQPCRPDRVKEQGS